MNPSAISASESSAATESSRASVVLAATKDAEASQDSAASSQDVAYDSSEASIASSTSSRVNSASSAGYSMIATPTASMLAIWNTPPRSGPAMYEFYPVNPNYDTAIIPDPCSEDDAPSTPEYIEVQDPKLGRVAGIRTAGDVPQRQALGTLQVSHHCFYEEDMPGNATIFRNGDTHSQCSPPSNWDMWNQTPNNGSCGEVQDVVQLVAICPYGSPGID